MVVSGGEGAGGGRVVGGVEGGPSVMDLVTSSKI